MKDKEPIEYSALEADKLRTQKWRRERIMGFVPPVIVVVALLITLAVAGFAPHVVETKIYTNVECTFLVDLNKYEVSVDGMTLTKDSKQAKLVYDLDSDMENVAVVEKAVAAFTGYTEFWLKDLYINIGYKETEK